MPNSTASGVRETLRVLVDLQQIDNRIATLKREVQNLPLQKSAINAKRLELEQTLEDSKKQLRQIELEKKSLELEVKTKQQKIQRYREQQARTRKNEEFQALNHEIFMLQEQITKLEDRELELMEEAEKLAPSLKKAEADFKAGLLEIEENLKAIDAKHKELEKHVADLTEKKQQVLSLLDAEVVENYERLLRTKNGVAVVDFHDEVCRGCWMKIPRETILLAKAYTEIVFCPNCGRILAKL